MRIVRILLFAIVTSVLLGGCAAVQNASDSASDSVNQAAGDTADWFQGLIPWDRRVDLLKFGEAPDETQLRALRALDQVNPLETAPKFLASLRAPFAMDPDAKLIECDNTGVPTGKFEPRGVMYWDVRLSRLRVDMVNYNCYSTFWQKDFEAGRDRLAVTLRAMWPAVVGYAHYMSNPDGLSSEKRSVSCVAGLLLWQLTQPFVLVHEEPPYLTKTQALVVLQYVKLRKSVNGEPTGNRADEGFSKHDPAGCQA